MRPSLALTSCLLALSALLVARPASAALRSPQVPVLGSGLQAYFNSVGEHIVVGQDQYDLQHWVGASNRPTFTFSIELGPKAPGDAVGFYSTNESSPALHELFPADAMAGWFAVGSFRTGPLRAVVNVFDESATFRGTHVYLGAERSSFSFYVSGPHGEFFVEDSRNPGGRAQFLVYAGTYINTGSWWIAGEDSSTAGSDSDQDYDDVVLFIEDSGCSCSPTVASTWGALKARFR